MLMMMWWCWGTMRLLTRPWHTPRRSFCCSIGPGWRWPNALRAEWGSAHDVEAAIRFSAEYFSSEMPLDYPCRSWLEAIAEELVAALGVYTVSSPEPLLIACHVVWDNGLVCLISEVYELTIHCKCDVYCCCSNYQSAMWRLMEKILCTMRCRWGHWLGEKYTWKWC